ncbi:MAG: ankyrin repeat domain-containing protein [Candidatus Anstonellales archaeon]
MTEKVDGKDKEKLEKKGFEERAEKQEMNERKRELSLFDLFREAERRKMEEGEGRVKQKDVNYKDEKDRTPIFYAVIKNDLEEVKRLISEGANLLLRDKNGLMPIDYATTPEVRRILSKEMKRQFLEG